MRRLPSQHHSGLTVIELLVSISIAAVVGVLIASFQVDTFSFNRRFSTSLSTIDRAQRLLRPMTAEIRSASLSGLGGFPIETADAYTFAFYSDIDSNGLKELVRYRLVGTTLFKDVVPQVGTTPAYYDEANKTSVSFIEGVQNSVETTPLFQYYSEAYIGGSEGEILAADQRIEDVRLVRITMRLKPTEATTPLTISTDVFIRNLKQ